MARSKARVVSVWAAMCERANEMIHGSSGSLNIETIGSSSGVDGMAWSNAARRTQLTGVLLPLSIAA